jgi:hypothetical protein
MLHQAQSDRTSCSRAVSSSNTGLVGAVTLRVVPDTRASRSTEMGPRVRDDLAQAEDLRDHPRTRPLTLGRKQAELSHRSDGVDDTPVLGDLSHRR